MTTPIFQFLSVRILLLFIPRAFSLSLPSPTAADIRFDEWCDRNGIFRVGVQTVTTEMSLGGRGLFATKPLTSGAVVASIPAELVVVAEDDVEWQVSITNQVMSMKDDKENEWIHSWNGSGQLELASLLEKRHEKDAVSSFVSSLVGQGKITQEGAFAEVDTRIQNFERRLKAINRSEDVAKWYVEIFICVWFSQSKSIPSLRVNLSFQVFPCHVKSRISWKRLGL